jgi:membrane protease YdiL (CAAX protease family)
LNGQQLLYNDAGRLKPGWRLVVFAVTTILSVLVSAALFGPMLAGFFGLLGAHVSNESWVLVIGFLAGTGLTLHIEKRPWSDVWLGIDAAKPSLLIKGFTVGAASIGVPIVLLVAARWLGLETGRGGSWWGGAIRITLVLLPAALLEELMTRGYVLSVLRDWWGWKWAIIATSAAFGLLHWQNAGATPGSLVLVTLAGFFLVAVLSATKSLYAVWMAHFAWNWVMAVIFHTAVSGTPFEAPDYRYFDAGPDWATGGDWGPEGGIPAAVGMIGGLVFLLRRRSVPPEQLHSTSMTQTTNAENV